MNRARKKNKNARKFSRLEERSATTTTKDEEEIMQERKKLSASLPSKERKREQKTELIAQEKRRRKSFGIKRGTREKGEEVCLEESCISDAVSLIFHRSLYTPK